MAEKPTRVKAPSPFWARGACAFGRLTKPHGLKGSLKVELFTDNPDERFAPNSVLHLQVPEAAVVRAHADRARTALVQQHASGVLRRGR